MENRQAGYTYEEALKIAEKNGEEVVPTYCAMCGPGANCRIFALKKGGKMTRVLGAPGGRNAGSVCARGLAAPRWQNSPDRITSPLLRVGARGEGKFRPISWEEAIRRVADKLLEQKEKYGPESLAILSPNLRNYKDISLRFLAVHGSPNHAHSGICALQRMFGYSYTLGAQPWCDYANSDLIIYWARQPVYSGPAAQGARAMLDAKGRKAKMVAIKPSLEADSTLADLWLPIRPGTDAALALALLHVVIGEDLIDHDFVENWCYGFAELKAHVLQFSPEWAEKICGIPAGQIRDLARLYATTKAACIDLGNGIEHAPSCNDVIRAVAILIAITGHLDRPGCNVFPNPPAVPQPQSIARPELYTKELVEKLVAPEFPLPFQPFMEGPTSAYYRVIESILTEKPYPIRALIAPGTQPTVSNRGTKKVIEALKKVEFFVVVDVMKCAEMDYADIVLPSTTTYEQDHPFALFGNTLLPNNKVVEGPAEARSTIQFFLDLATAMGYGEDFWNGDVDALENFRLQPYGLTVEDLRKNPSGIKLPSSPAAPRYEKYTEVFARQAARVSGGPYLPQGKAALYNTTFEALGYTPMPVWREVPEGLTATPELAEKYPLILSDYHTSKNFNAAWLRNVPALRALSPEPELHIHPSAAKARGIEHGDWVRVESPHGHIRVKACCYEGIRPDTVMMLHGWWQGCSELGLEDMPILDGGANVNLLYSTGERAYDPLVTAMSSQTLVEVSKYE